MVPRIEKTSIAFSDRIFADKELPIMKKRFIAGVVLAAVLTRRVVEADVPEMVSEMGLDGLYVGGCGVFPEATL